MSDPTFQSCLEPPHHKKLERREVLMGVRLLTCSCYRREAFLEADWIKDELVVSLERTRKKHGFCLLAWVMMPEHFHLLLVPRLPESPVDEVLNMLKSTMSRRVLARVRERSLGLLSRAVTPTGKPRFWQTGGGHDHNVRDEDRLSDITRYIHDNPVQRGLVAAAVDWPWSSARWYDGRRDGAVVIDDLREFRSREWERLDRLYGGTIEAARAVRERFAPKRRQG